MRIRHLAAAAGMAGLGVLASAPAWADLTFSPYGPSDLVLTLSHGDALEPVARSVTLRCFPDAGGAHPAPAAACHALRAVHGDFAALRGEPGVCTQEWNPVTVTARGVWDGRHVDYDETFSNACTLLRERGVVFQLTPRATS